MGLAWHRETFSTEVLKRRRLLPRPVGSVRSTGLTPPFPLHQNGHIICSTPNLA